MYTIELGLFPLTGLLIGGILYAIYRFALRLKCPARLSQTFILSAIIATTACSMVAFSMLKEPSPLALQDTSTHDPFSEKANQGSPATFSKSADVLQPTLTQGLSTSPVTEDSRAGDKQPFLTALFTDAFPLLGGIYLVGMLAMLCYFLAQLAYLYRFRKYQQQTEIHGGATVYEMTRGCLPFSFGHSIFLPKTLSDDDYVYVMAHELSHIRHHHSAWACFMELLVCLNWYNPFAWMLFSEMRLQQELEVDSDVLSSGIDRVQYQMSLLSISTQRGKWLLPQQAFIGEPLKKRLLFMNTSINPHHANMKMTLASISMCALLATLAILSCQTRLKEPEHPLQGCWKMATHYHADKSPIWPIIGGIYKFYGDYGELVLQLSYQKGSNIDFMFSGMEQHVQGDKLTDKRGNPIQYSLDNDSTLTWHWPEKEPDADHPQGLITIEKWHRATVGTDILNLFRTICTPTKTSGTHGMNGVWEMDSLKLVTTGVEDVCNLDRDFLIIHDNIYMRLTYVTENIDNPYIDFKLGGDGGEFSVNDKGDFILQERIFDLKPQTDKDHIVLYKNPANYPDANNIGILLYYRRTEMPEFLPRLLAPALSLPTK